MNIIMTKLLNNNNTHIMLHDDVNVILLQNETLTFIIITSNDFNIIGFN